MAPRKRARTAGSSSSSAAAPAAAALTLSGGTPFPPRAVAYWRDEKFCDAKLRVEGKVFEAHRLVLAAGSDFLAAQFEHPEMTRDKTAPLELPEMPAAAFGAALEYLYDGACALQDEALLVPLLQVAHRLQIVPLIDAAVKAVVERLSPDNCLDAWGLGYLLDLSALEAAAAKEAARGFEAVAATEAFVALPQPRATALLGDTRLAVRSEEAVYEAAARWVRGQPAAAREAAVALFACVRFPLLSEAFVAGTVRQEPLLQCFQGQRLMRKAMQPAVYARRPAPRSR